MTVEPVAPAFMRSLPSRETSVGWAIPCPDRHSTNGFSVIVRADESLGRWRFECVEAGTGDLCGSERELVRLLGLTESEIRIGLGETGAVRFVTGAEFVANPIPQAEPIVVDTTGSTVIAAAGFELTYGDGGAGKTTLWLDGAMHFAAGIEWLGGLMTPTRPLPIGWVENEGPQEEFRRKLERKLAAWSGRVPPDRFHVLDTPWGALDLGNPEHRAGIADAVTELDLDLLIIGPLNDLGMEGGGTPDEVRKGGHGKAAITDLMHSFGPGVSCNGHSGDFSE